MTTTFRVHAIDDGVLARVREGGLDASNNPVVSLRAEGAEPLRCCLRDAHAGEALILFGYEPPIDAASPYRERGAVFAHAEPCGGAGDAGYPAAWRGRRQVLRGYDRRGWIVDAFVHDGAEPELAIEQLFAKPEVVQLHSRNVAYGCFMFVVTRP